MAKEIYPKRYTPSYSSGLEKVRMVENDSGEWVKYEDFAFEAKQRNELETAKDINYIAFKEACPPWLWELSAGTRHLAIRIATHRLDKTLQLAKSARTNWMNHPNDNIKTCDVVLFIDELLHSIEG